MAYNKITMDKIAAQALNEIDFARKHKQGKIGNWQLNEQLYYSKKNKTTDSRANIQLSRMQEFVHNLLSKIDNPLIFKYVKRKNSQLKRVERLNALVTRDRDIDDWDIKDIAGKKQGIIYGRAIYSYYADSIDGYYQPHLENIDVYDFLIDPEAGGLDIEKANYLGNWGVVFTRKGLERGARKGDFIKDNVKVLLDGAGNTDEKSQEETNKSNRVYKQGTQTSNKDIGNPDRFKFWRWFTTYEDERYYLLINNAGQYIKCVKVVDMFSPTKFFRAGAWPYWSWAAFIDLTEFWTPSFCDFAREIFMTQDISIGQMVDNAEAINKPQKAVNVNAFENLAELKYRRDGVIRIKQDYDINKVIQYIKPESIDTPIKVYNLLEAIQQKASGVTEQTAGVADTQGRVAIYEGNQQAESDRFGLLNKSYSFGYKRFAKLYEIGVRDNLIKKVAIDILGPDGAEVHEVKKSDIFKKNDDFNVLVEASNAEYLTSTKEKEAKLKFLQSNTNNKNVNQKKSFEMQAKIAGFNPDEIKELQDTSFYGNSELMSECDRDIESLLEGEDIKPNQAANNAYKQKMKDYLQDHIEDLNAETFKRFVDYINQLEDIIMRNEARSLLNEQTSMLNEPIEGEEVPVNTPGKQRDEDIIPPVEELNQLNQL